MFACTGRPRWGNARASRGASRSAKPMPTWNNQTQHCVNQGDDQRGPQRLRGAGVPPRSTGPDVVRVMSTEQWLDFIGISMDPKRAEG